MERENTVMVKVYTGKQRLLTSHCDMRGAWKPSAVLETMQDVAGEHSNLLGVGHDAVHARGISWVVTRYELVMARYPHFGDTVLTETYPTSARHGFYTRTYVFRNETGMEYGYASSLWTLLDLEKRSMIHQPIFADSMPDNRDLDPRILMPGAATELSVPAETAIVRPQYTDIDDTLHVNNVKYVDWCCNAMGISTMQSHELAHLLVNYQKEIRPGDEVRTELRQDGRNFSYRGFEGEEPHFAIAGELRPR